MAWPQATDYSAAVQNPDAHFRDEDLRRGVIATDLLMGLPLIYSGNFASVFKVLGGENQAWAVKCFTRPVADLQHRYQAISDHLNQERRRFAVDFVYLSEGILVQGVWYPVLKMRWIEGFTFNEFLRDHAGQPAVLEQLASLWLRLATEMREARMAHGDLQHGNVMLVPSTKSSSIALRLVDYDGLWVPQLATQPSGEVGHPNYQHPQRLDASGYSAEVDRFAHLVIYSALRCLIVGGQGLWDRHDNGENLLFRSGDFRQPGKSPLFHNLLTLSPDLLPLLGHLVDASQQPLSQVPLLTDLVSGRLVAPLTREQIDRLEILFPEVPWPRPAFNLLQERPPPTTAEQNRPDSRTGVHVPPLPSMPPPTTQVAAAVVLSGYARASNPEAPRRIPPPPRPQQLPWPPLPSWVSRFGLPTHSWPVRYWPVVLVGILSLPGILLLLWLVFTGRLFPKIQPRSRLRLPQQPTTPTTNHPL